MSKVFDPLKIHTLIRKLLQTKITGTIKKFIANYAKERKACTTYRDHISIKFQTCVLHGGVLSPTLFNIYQNPEHRFMPWPTQMTSPHKHTQARGQPSNTYSHTYIKFLPGQNITILH